MTLGDIDLIIDELILNGVESGDREGMRSAVERELERMLLEQGIPPSLAQSADVEQLEAGSVDIGKGMGPNTLGARIAHTLYREMGR